MSTPVVNTVLNATQTHSSNTPIPKCLWVLFRLINKVHRVWRWFRHASVYSNPDNFSGLITGHIVSFIFEKSRALRVAAQVVMICRHLLECIEQMKVIAQAYKDWINAIKGNYQSKVKITWEKSESSCLPPSLMHSIRTKFHKCIERIVKVAVATFYMIKSLFVLSMYIMDAIEAFSMSPEKSSESRNQFFVNGKFVLDAILEKQRDLVKTIDENKELIQDILTGIKAPFGVGKLRYYTNLTVNATIITKAIIIDTPVSIVNFIKRSVVTGYYYVFGKNESGTVQEDEERHYKPVFPVSQHARNRKFVHYRADVAAAAA